MWPLVAGIVSNYFANQGGGGVGADPMAMQRMADPFAPYRAGYAQQLNELMQSPASITTTPWYQAGMEQGQDVLSRTLSARGQAQSGSEQIALQKFGMNYFNDQFSQMFNRFATLSGANRSPVAGAEAAAGASRLNMQNWSQLGGFVGAGLQNLFSSPQPQGGATSLADITSGSAAMYGGVM